MLPSRPIISSIPNTGEQISTIPNDRYAFMAKLGEKKVDLIKVGYLPYAMMEEYGRLRNAFRNWRNPAPLIPTMCFERIQAS